MAIGDAPAQRRAASKTAIQRGLRAALLILAMCAATLGPRPAIAQNVIQSIEVTGAQRIERETIISFLQLNPGDEADPAKINDALKRMFATGLFKDITITRQVDGVLLVAVEENPIINEIAFEGNRAIENEVLQAQIRSRRRTAFTRARAEADAQALLDLYRASGRFSATVEPKIIEREDNRVDLVFEISEGEEIGVSAINFVGNAEYSDRRLRRAIQTEETAFWKIFTQTDNYDPDRLEFDKQLLRRFYFARGYADFAVLSATAELNPERTGFFITFTVSEGEQYDIGTVAVTSEVPDVAAEDYEDLVETDEGDTYDADLVERTVKRMQEQMARTGVNFVNVRPRSKKRRGENDEQIIDLTYELVQAPRVFVERIDIEGNVRTLDKVIRREFLLSEGDAFNAFRLQQSQENIRALGFFGDVQVKTDRGSSSDRVVIRTTVEERSTGDISFGVGFSTADALGGQVTLTERNFLGRGQFVRASASITAERQFFDFRFREPYFLDRDLLAGFDLFHTEIDNQDESSFDTRRTGFRPTIGFALDERQRLNLSYTIEQDNIVDVPDSASPLITRDRGERVISTFGATYSFDTRDSRTRPTRGMFLQVSNDFAGLGGDALNFKTEGSVKGYTSFFREEVVFSLELAGGALLGFGGDDDIKVTDRFTLGGDSFRGFQRSGIGPRDSNEIQVDGDNENINDALGGEYYAITRADVSFPLGLPEEYGVYGGLFADAGSVWGLEESDYSATNTDGNPDTFNIEDEIALRATVGASIFWTSPFGPLRLNFATPLLKEEQDEEEFFRFSAGTRF
ncbi:MAG: outer membrane protein assembly factor BamA [Pseudomonadota bacterium]